MHQMFQKHSNLGLLGVAGCKQLPRNGVWWKGNGLVGEVHMDKLYHFGDVTRDYEEVQGIDGLLMATQYDLLWREDLFPGFHFYDISQSLEFQRKGYSVGIPKQIEPWCYHLDNDVSTAVRSLEYQRNQQILIQNYPELGKV
jgi:hypothetical protein